MNLKSYINENNRKVLLIDPTFPPSRKSRNHSDLLPVGLLKIGAYLKTEDIEVKLLRLNSNYDISEYNKFNPDLILITSVFTYWAEYVKDAVSFSRKIFPNVPVLVGGIYASLCPDSCKNFTKCDEVIVGTVNGAEGIAPDYSLLGVDAKEIDYQVIHSTRGCNRKCEFCGVYKIEPEFLCKKSIKDEIIRKKLVFYDNNLLANPYIEDLLNELINLRNKRIITQCESQSGFDGRILVKTPNLGKLLKYANFKNPKIAWDGSYETKSQRKKELDVLINAGYKPKDISIFMVYNYKLNYEEMEKKRVECFNWGVQISDCRYRPLDRIDDNYNPYAKKPQTNKDYHINSNWTDELVRKFRSNVRKHNICIRHEMKYYSNMAERKKISKSKSLEYRHMNYQEAKKFLHDAWNPAEIYIF